MADTPNIKHENIRTNSFSSATPANGNDSVIVSASITEFSKGPLPHPELLKGYDDIIDNGAERIMQMAEAEQRNRFQKDKAEIDSAKTELSLIKRGQTMAFALCILFVSAGHSPCLFKYAYHRILLTCSWHGSCHWSLLQFLLCKA